MSGFDGEYFDAPPGSVLASARIVAGNVECVFETSEPVPKAEVAR